MSTEEEFDSVAAWTIDALADLPAADAIPGACQGSGNPATLAWLADRLDVGPGSRVIDVGGGIGGPAAWLRQRTGAVTVVGEPMVGALRGARRLFDLDAVAVDAAALPFAAASCDGAWVLATLSTVGDKAAALAEARRVLRPGAHLGVQDWVRTTAEAVPDPPEGNDFATADELVALLDEAGFDLEASVEADEFDDDPEWDRAGDQVDHAVEARHPGADALEQSRRQQARFGELLRDGTLAVWAMVARAR